MALGWREERDVRVVEGQVEQEGLGFVLLDELHREVSLAEFAFTALGRFGAGIRLTCEIFIEAMVGRLMAFTAEVPLTHRG